MKPLPELLHAYHEWGHVADCDFTGNATGISRSNVLENYTWWYQQESQVQINRPVHLLCITIFIISSLCFRNLIKLFLRVAWTAQFFVKSSQIFWFVLLCVTLIPNLICSVQYIYSTIFFPATQYYPISTSIDFTRWQGIEKMLWWYLWWVLFTG